MNPPGPGRLDHLADEQLAVRAAAGDRSALDVLLRRHQRLVYRVCRRLCAGEADALDATQEALVTVARRIDRFDARSAFTTWLYRVTTNACLDELRRHRRRPRPVHVEDGSGADRSGASGGGRSRAPADPADLASLRVDLDRALSRLSAAARTVIVLRDLVGLDYGDIAAVLDVPAGTVKSRLARARAQLAADLAGTAPDRGNHRDPVRRPSSEALDLARPPTSPAGPASPDPTANRSAEPTL